jgi:uncharacterized protein YkwD
MMNAGGHQARHAFALLLCLAAGSAAPAIDARTLTAAPAPIIRGPSAGTAVGRAETQDLVARINRHRRAIGCRALAWDERLARVAQRHSEDMARRGYFSHVDPGGRDPFDRMRGAGIRFRAAAENLAMGQRTGEETFDGWMGSRGHRKNLEECVYTRIGIGLYRGRWTCMMSKPVG